MALPKVVAPKIKVRKTARPVAPRPIRQRDLSRNIELGQYASMSRRPEGPPEMAEIGSCDTPKITKSRSHRNRSQPSCLLQF